MGTAVLTPFGIKMPGSRPHVVLSMMRITGLEPARGCPPEPKSGASANFAISAYFFKERCGNNDCCNESLSELFPYNKKQPESTDRLNSYR